jgi:hypothetical protein
MMRNTALVVMFLAGMLAAGPARAQEASPEETLIYSEWHAASTAQDAAKAKLVAEDYLKKYPEGAYAAYLKQWLGQLEGQRLNEAIAKKDVAALVQIGQAKLQAEPENLDYALAVAFNLRRFELFASPPSDAHLAEIKAFSEKALALIAAGKLPTGADPAKWDKGQALGWLHQNLAIVASKQEQAEEALAQFEKSAAADPKNRTQNAYSALLSGSLLKSRYDGAVVRYKALPEEQRTAAEPAPEAKAVLEEANAWADKTLEAYARFLALSEGQAAFSATRARVEKTASDLWGYRHPEDPGGLAAFVAKQAGVPNS